MSTTQLNTLEEKDTRDQWLARVGTIYEQQRAAAIDAISPDIAVNRTVNVAGFDLLVADTDASKEIREKLVAEIQAAEKVRAELAAAGIKPIAILAEGIFNSIVAKAKGLYTFKSMNAVGEVLGNGKAIAERLPFRNSDPAIWSALLGVLLPTVLFFFNLSGWNLVFAISYVSSVALTLIIPTGMYMHSEKELPFAETMIRVHTHLSPIVFLTRYFYRASVLKNKKKLLWPERLDLGSGEDRFKLSLPEPPQHVKEKLLLCHRHGIETFLIADQKAFDVVIDNETQRQLQKKYDPIIAYKSGRVIAIIDQFGDFKQEKEIIDYVTEHFSAIQRSLVPAQQN